MSFEQLNAVADEGVSLFLDDMKDIMNTNKKQPLVKQIVRECYDIKIDWLKLDDGHADKALLDEILRAKLGSLAHVLDIQRLVVSKQAAEAVVRALKSMLSGFAVVAKALLKTAVSTAVGGVAGGLLGSAGEKLAEKALEAGEKLVDNVTEDLVEKLDDEVLEETDEEEAS